MYLSQILAIVISITVFNGIIGEIAFNQILSRIDVHIDNKIDPDLIKELKYFPWRDIYINDHGWLYVSEDKTPNWLGLPDSGWYLASNQ